MVHRSIIGRALIPVVALTPCASTALFAQAAGIREVSASPRTLIPLQTRIRYTTMIVLPEDEEILDVICGDKDYWVVSSTHNMAHVKPAKEGATTNLNLVTGSGAVYSFLLSEKSGNSSPDLKVYVEADPSAPRKKPRYFTVAQMEEVRKELMESRLAAEATERRAAEQVAAFQQQYPTRLQFAYGTAKHEKPFLVRAIWHDGQFTYIKAEGTDLPALYEVEDGKPSLVNFQVHGGTYVVPKVLERGYLALGKARFEFQQQAR